MMLSDLSATQEGDVGFYVTHNSIIDRAIVLRTGSQIVHVAVFTGKNTTVAATSDGITEQESGGEYAVWRPTGGYNTNRLREGLNFLAQQIGQPYGYADIANQLLLFAGHDTVLLDKSADCSDLATRFLWVAGVALPWALIHTDIVTPGGLYTALGAIQ